jgi:NAD(P)-dependent dehydrogenase (short-subunit alcohol dehydrogenase family)
MKAKLGFAALAGLSVLAARRLGEQGGEEFTFRDKVALVTGASRGLGLVMARQMGLEGAKLAIVARTAEDLERAAKDLRDRGAEVLVITGDIGVREVAEDAVHQTVERFGCIDVLVNNAGVIQVGPLEHMSSDDFRNAMDVHFWGPFYLMGAAIPHMREQGEGRIVNITSIGGKMAVPHLAPYAASKFALVGLSDAFRSELARYRIHVTTVAPGLMRTGSPYRALFKGQHRREFAWFSVLDSLYVTSIDAEEAASQILHACRRGDPELTITWQARAAAIANAVVPGFMGRVLAITNAFLPKPTGRSGDAIATGWENRQLVQDWALLEPTKKAAQENNELAVASTS